MAAKHYHSAELIFGWSFYRQSSSGEISSADEFSNNFFFLAYQIKAAAKKRRLEELDKRDKK